MRIAMAKRPCPRRSLKRPLAGTLGPGLPVSVDSWTWVGDGPSTGSFGAMNTPLDVIKPRVNQAMFLYASFLGESSHVFVRVIFFRLLQDHCHGVFLKPGLVFYGLLRHVICIQYNYIYMYTHTAHTYSNKYCPGCTWNIGFYTPLWALHMVLRYPFHFEDLLQDGPWGALWWCGHGHI